MPTMFDWQEEEDMTWVEPIREDDSSSTKSAGTRRRIIFVLALILIISGAVLAFQRIQNHVVDTESLIENEVKATYELFISAVETKDPEVLAAVLSARDPRWVETQLELLDQGLLLDRHFFDLMWQPKISPVSMEVTVWPDLHSAELAAIHAYQIQIGNSRQETVLLEQSSTLRLSDGGWLVEVQRLDYWGNWKTVEGKYITLSFPERDEVLSRRLAADLEGILAAACAQLSSQDCLPVHARFVADPSEFTDLARPESQLEARRELRLPTPSLIGLPREESGYEAIFRALASRVVAAQINVKTGWECCQAALFYQAIMDLRLRDLGLQNWPLNEQDYRRTLALPAEYGRQLWEDNSILSDSYSSPEWGYAYALIEYLADGQSGAYLAKIQQNLASAASFTEWFSEVLDESDRSIIDFNRSWSKFLEQRSFGSDGAAVKGPELLKESG